VEETFILSHCLFYRHVQYIGLELDHVLGQIKRILVISDLDASLKEEKSGGFCFNSVVLNCVHSIAFITVESVRSG